MEEHCGCRASLGPWTIEAVLEMQKAGDFLIAAAYFSIPLELLYFTTCSSAAALFPLKWVLLQFGAFIVLCGITHLLAVFTYDPFNLSLSLVLALTVAKLLTALVSVSTAISLLTLIPQLLRAKLRETLLRRKATELGREVGIMKRKEEAGWHVRMLTREIRKSLDRHTILDTTIAELSAALGLLACAVWMPDDAGRELLLRGALTRPVPMADPDAAAVVANAAVRILPPQSALAPQRIITGGGGCSVAAIRMPMLNFSNFKGGGTPEVVETKYAILVLVLPGDGGRSWSACELEIVEVVADQVAVALSHAALLEESQAMRERLAEQREALLRARQQAVTASETRNLFLAAMARGMRQPLHSILGLLSVIEQDNLSAEQRLIVNAAAKSGGVVAMLINDVVAMERELPALTMRPLELHAMIREALTVADCLCRCNGVGMQYQVDSSLPDNVVGDEKRVLHILMHMVGAVKKGSLRLRVRRWTEDELVSSAGDCVPVVFEIGGDDSHSISICNCKTIVQRMNGDIWSATGSGSIILALRFRKAPAAATHGLPPAIPNFKGLRVLLVDNDDANRGVSRIMLQKLGCRVTSAASGIHCLSCLDGADGPHSLAIVELHLPKMDGFKLSARIRKFSGRKGQPLIVGMTASSDADVWERCVRGGMKGLIRKPATVAAMGDELYRVLELSY